MPEIIISRPPVRRACKLASALFALVLALASRANGSDDLPSELDRSPYWLNNRQACGPLCFAFLERYFGGRRNYVEISTLCPPGAQGTNLRDLNAGLQKLGYTTASFEGDVETLKRLSVPAILHYGSETGQADHFVVLLGWKPETQRFRIYDPTGKLKDVNSAIVAEKFTGVGLLVSNGPIADVGGSLAFLGGRTKLAAGVSTFLVVIIASMLTSRFRDRRRAMASSSLRLLFAAAILGLSSTACAPAPKAATGSSTDTASRYAFDAGKVQQGAKIKHTFQVLNPTSDTIAVKLAAHECSCRILLFQQDRAVETGRVPPGGSIEVRVTIPTNELEGPYLKTFQLSTDSAQSAFRELTLTVRAQIQTILQVVPSQLQYGSIGPGERAVRRLTIRSEFPDLFEKLRSVESSNPLVALRMVEKGLGLLAFDVTVDPSMPNGDFSSQLAFHFDYPDYREVNVLALGRRTGDLAALPTHLVIGTSAQPGATSARARVYSRSKGPFRITSLSATKGLTVSCTDAIEPATSHELRIATVLSGALDSERPMVTLETDRAQEAILQIPVTVIGASKSNRSPK